jgi:hypothetical protein
VRQAATDARLDVRPANDVAHSRQHVHPRVVADEADDDLHDDEERAQLHHLLVGHDVRRQLKPASHLLPTLAPLFKVTAAAEKRVVGLSPMRVLSK